MHLNCDAAHKGALTGRKRAGGAKGLNQQRKAADAAVSERLALWFSADW
jgi:hypothetical protein